MRRKVPLTLAGGSAVGDSRSKPSCITSSTWKEPAPLFLQAKKMNIFQDGAADIVSDGNSLSLQPACWRDCSI